MTEWKFKLGEPIALSLSGERGVIAGRSDYEDGSQRYLARYLRCTHGGATQEEAWFSAADLVKQQTVLMTERELLLDELWQKLFARWEKGGRVPLTDEDLDEINRSGQ